MMELLIFATALGLLVCYSQPRVGIFITLTVGFVADPIRKILPGEPVSLVVLVAVFVVVTFAGALKGGLLPRPRTLIARAGPLRTPVAFFCLLVAIQSVFALMRTGSAVIAGIGLLAYLAPAPAILLGYGAAGSERGIVRIIRFYSAIAAVFASGIFLSALGWDNQLLSGVGEELVVYSSTTGEALRLLSGFFRTSEIAAWHCATAACLLVVVSVAYRRRRREMWIAMAATIYFLMAIVFTGRRKAFASIVLFALVFGVLLWKFRRGTRTLAGVALVAAVFTGVFGETSVFSEHFASRYQMYLEREQTTTPTTALERLKMMTVDSTGNILDQNGLLGAGAGTGSQGAQHFGGGTEIVGGSVEGGFGKILAELGVPGVGLLLWIAFLLVRRLLSEFRRLPRGDSARAGLALGFLAFLATNAIEFATAHQVYGDPFVLLMLGWVLGFLLAVMRPASTGRAAATAQNLTGAAMGSRESVQVRPIDLTLVRSE